MSCWKSISNAQNSSGDSGIRWYIWVPQECECGCIIFINLFGFRWWSVICVGLTWIFSSGPWGLGCCWLTSIVGGWKQKWVVACTNVVSRLGQNPCVDGRIKYSKCGVLARLQVYHKNSWWLGIRGSEILFHVFLSWQYGKICAIYHIVSNPWVGF